MYTEGENYNNCVCWKSEDYTIREAMLCGACDTMLRIAYDELFSSCGCGTQEWYL